MPHINYGDIESLIIKEIDECANNPENSSRRAYFLRIFNVNNLGI